jgi:hypothetical protein
MAGVLILNYVPLLSGSILVDRRFRHECRFQAARLSKCAFVMRGLVPRIHVHPESLSISRDSWMPGTSPGMTIGA